MRHIAFACTLFIAFLSFADSPLNVKGVIKDKESNEPIPFAHVLIGDVINISNIDGEFVISAADFDSNGIELKVSYMGYQDYSQTIEDLDGYHTVYLEPSVKQLEEVVVMTGPSIMEQVFNRFHINYEMGRQHMVGYYQESMADWEKTYYVAEGIMDIYTPSNMDKLDYPLVKPLRTRKKVFNEIDLIDEVLGGNASDMAQSSIWREQSFLSPKNRKNYDYFYSGATTMGTHDVLIVDFEPKNNKGNTKGKLYVEDESLAILKIEYHPIIRDFSHWESVSWTEEYEQKNGMFEMISVSFSGTSTNHEFNYHALLVINQSNPITALPEDIPMLDVYDSFFEQAQDDFTDSFWTGFNFMKLDSEVAQLVDKNHTSDF